MKRETYLVSSIIAVVCGVLVSPLTVWAEGPYFFRVVSTQQTQMMSFHHDGAITWSNVDVNAKCSIEWSYAMDGIWLTNHFSGEIQPSNCFQTIQLPDRFLEGVPSTIVQKELGQSVTYYPDVTVDMNDDGIVDITFFRYAIGDPEGMSSVKYWAAKGSELCAAPFTTGTMIGAACSWTSSTWQVTLASCPCITEPWGPVYGPWGGFSYWDSCTAYLPLKFLVDGKIHYGWIYMALSGSGDWTLYSCAYEAIPNKGVVAGVAE